MGNAGERPSTDNRRNIGCSEMRALATPVPLSFAHLPTPSATVLEVVGQNSHPAGNSGFLLDTLAQPVTGRKNLQKRARTKHITNVLSIKLADLRTELRTSYWNAYHCCTTLRQDVNTVIGKYCNTRWCLTCNRIRTAKLINGYGRTITTLPDKRFLTLTVPNVPGNVLKRTIEDMTRTLFKIRMTLKKRGTSVIGIRKLEVTYNNVRNDFHPHFHLIISGNNVAQDVIDEWLRHYPSAERHAQDVRAADDNSVMELFKYFTKLVTKNRFHVQALDTIFTAMKGKRTFQAMGIKKQISEDVEEIQRIIYEDLEPREAVWTWVDEATDWIDQETGETLTGYTPSEAVKQLLNTC